MDLNSGSDRKFDENTLGIKFWTKPLYKDKDHLHIFFIDV